MINYQEDSLYVHDLCEEELMDIYHIFANPYI